MLLFFRCNDKTDYFRFYFDVTHGVFPKLTSFYQFHLILVQFEGENTTLSALKVSHLERLNSEIFALLSTLFSRLKIAHLIKQIGITLWDL
ncbi:hypothetical protein ELR70_21395 [Pseudoalteromonas sp. R3]|nr:hypothetical protein ELR70_21395 [Pseudoalteromonas sp. R3]